jgi:hypothetical protein
MTRWQKQVRDQTLEEDRTDMEPADRSGVRGRSREERILLILALVVVVAFSAFVATVIVILTR